MTVGSKGPGAIDAPELLGEDRGLDRAEPDAAVASGTVSAGQPSSTIVLHSAVGPRAGLDDRAGERDRDSLTSTVADRVAQLFLVVGEVEFHSARGRLSESPALRDDRSASARRSTFSIAVSGSASTTARASGSL